MSFDPTVQCNALSVYLHYIFSIPNAILAFVTSCIIDDNVLYCALNNSTYYSNMHLTSEINRSVSVLTHKAKTSSRCFCFIIVCHSHNNSIWYFYCYREEKTESLSECKEEMDKTHGKYNKLRQEVIYFRI